MEWWYAYDFGDLNINGITRMYQTFHSKKLVNLKSQSRYSLLLLSSSLLFGFRRRRHVVVNLLSLAEQGAGFVAVSSTDNLWANRWYLLLVLLVLLVLLLPVLVGVPPVEERASLLLLNVGVVNIFGTSKMAGGFCTVSTSFLLLFPFSDSASCRGDGGSDVGGENGNGNGGRGEIGSGDGGGDVKRQFCGSCGSPSSFCCCCSPSGWLGGSAAASSPLL